ncbi:MAG TPA: aspartate carbamoyltransferase catalytic subunit [Ignavibacteria bacterium]|nr:aspartate carbamoyltransferase catalytic subunit [Ignavibacteria bacterium]
MNFPYNLSGLRNLDLNYFEEIFELTKYFKKLIVEKKTIKEELRTRSVINLFFENSTRTLTSFELAEKMMGMNTVSFTSGGSSMSKGESLLDTIRNIDAMNFDYTVIRHSTPGIPLLLQKFTDSKIINAGDGRNEHPTQGLLDIFTLKEIYGDIKGLNVCIMGDISHSRVALSNIYGLKKYDVNVSVCGPVSFIPRDIEGLGVNVFHDPEEAVRKNDVLNVLRVQLERDAGYLIPSLNEYNRHYGLDERVLRSNKSIKILHPGPMNINVEIDYNLTVSENSYIFQQVTNGLAVKCAIFKLMNDNKN